MTAPLPARAPLSPPPPAPRFIRPALGLLAGLGIALVVIGPGVVLATLAALQGVRPTQFVATPGYLAVVSTINLLGAMAGGFTTARITAGRSFYTVFLLATIMLMSGVAQAMKGTPKPGEPTWYPLGLAILAAAGALAGGALERRRAGRAEARG